MWKIAHRGASGHAPENTLLALKTALKMGADGLECDVHRCKSGEAVVIHDASLKRTTGVRGKVADHTLAELRKLDAGQGEKIPTLEEYIKAIGSRMLFIEIKDAVVVDEVVRLVTRYGEKNNGYERLIVIGFLWKSLLEVKKQNPRILIGTTPRANLPPAAFLAKATAANMWSVNPCIDRLTQRFVNDAHARGFKIITWTANTKAQIEKAKRLGVDGIIGDYPERL